MIAARGLTKRYGSITAVDHLDFDVPRGAIVGFLGPNGAGKSTALRMITGYLQPTSGSVTVDDLPVDTRRVAVQRRIGYLPESTPLYTEMRVVEYLRWRARIFGVSHRSRRRAIDRVIHRCWLEHVRRRPISQLSKGYRQRVGLAATMLHDPPVLIFDEPGVGLDPSQIRELRTLLRSLAGQHTVLLSSHILAEVELTCDRIIMIASGRIRAQGGIDELKREAAKQITILAEVDRADAESIAKSIDAVHDVETSRLEDDWHRLMITVRPGADDPRTELTHRLGEQNIALRELTRMTPSLEQLFLQYISGPQPERPAAKTAAPVTSAPGKGGPS
jgi:ABC-2 type transport system ATP-binding protein